MQGLNILLSRYSHLLVLRALFHAQQPLSGREIERRTGLSNRATMLALDFLTAQAAVLFSEQGHSHQYTLNRTNYFVMKALKPAFEAEDVFWTDFRKAVRRHVHPFPMAAVATGPLARDETSLNLKIELTMLFATGRHRIRAFGCMDALGQAVWNRYAATIEPVLLDLNTMDQDKYDTLWRRVAREGVLLFGSLP